MSTTLLVANAPINCIVTNLEETQDVRELEEIKTWWRAAGMCGIHDKLLDAGGATGFL